MRAISMVLACAVLGVAPAQAQKVKKLSFSPEDSQALVIVEEREGLRGGFLNFVKVDLAMLRREDSKLVVDKTTNGRLRTTNPGLQTKGEGLMVPKDMSRFSAAKGPAGDYVLVDFTYGAFGGRAGACSQRGVPIFRFQPGKANLVTAEMLPGGGGSTNILAYAAARNGSNADLTDAQEILAGYPRLKGEVVAAQFLGWYQFKDDKGNVSGCGKGKTLVPLPAAE